MKRYHSTENISLQEYFSQLFSVLINDQIMQKIGKKIWKTKVFQISLSVDGIVASRVFV